MCGECVASVERATLADLPSFPCGFAEPFVNFKTREVIWTFDGDYYSTAFDIKMNPDEARGIARRLLELADIAESGRKEDSK